VVVLQLLLVQNGPSCNRGCEAIDVSTSAILGEAYPTAKIVNHHHPKHASLAGLVWQYDKRIRGHKFSYERHLSDSTVAFSLGGDVFSNDYGVPLAYLEGNDKIISSKAKWVIWGASIGPFESSSDVETRFVNQFRHAHLIVVREGRTRSYLESLGIVDNVVQMPDPAFVLKPESAALPEQLEGALAEGAIGLNLSPLLAHYRPDPGRWTEECAAAVSSLRSAVTAPVVLIPHVMCPHSDDFAFLEDVRARLAQQADLVHLLDAREMSAGQIKHVIARLRIFIGARTHATIAALSEGVPTGSIGYSVKSRGINEDIFGHDRWVLDHQQLDGATLVELAQALLAEEKSLRAHLFEMRRDYRMKPDAVRAALALI
jgi:colanic acid/amylovoran biosynthesis protein